MRRGWHGQVYGVCPVQGDGKVNNDTWYFKARGEKWTFEVLGKPELRRQQSWGTWPDAGYMSIAQAWEIITGIMNEIKSLEK